MGNDIRIETFNENKNGTVLQNRKGLSMILRLPYMVSNFAIFVFNLRLNRNFTLSHVHFNKAKKRSLLGVLDPDFP